MKRVYIAGPMRGTFNLNRPVFEEVAAALRDEGFVVESPIEIGARFGTDQELLNDKDLLLKVMNFEEETIRTCDAIALLPDWEKSQGARQELLVALREQLQIIPIKWTNANTVWVVDEPAPAPTKEQP